MGWDDASVGRGAAEGVMLEIVRAEKEGPISRGAMHGAERGGRALGCYLSVPLPHRRCAGDAERREPEIILERHSVERNPTRTDDLPTGISLVPDDLRKNLSGISALLQEADPYSPRIFCGERPDKPALSEGFCGENPRRKTSTHIQLRRRIYP
jgi:hypothetical protein